MVGLCNRADRDRGFCLARNSRGRASHCNEPAMGRSVGSIVGSKSDYWRLESLAKDEILLKTPRVRGS